MVVAVGLAVTVPGLLFGASASLAAALVAALVVVASPGFRDSWRSEVATLMPFARAGAVAAQDERVMEVLANHELSRARRYERPLTLVSLSIPGAGRRDRQRLVDVIGAALRETDLLGSAADGRVHVVLPETSAEAARALVPRLCDALPSELAEAVRVGTASFPADEVTWLALRDAAAAREAPLPRDDEPRDPPPPLRAPTTTRRIRLRRIQRRSSVGVVRRAVDVTVVLLAAPVVLPLLALLAVAIRLDSPGPILHRHERLGRGGRPVRLLKLRTMVKHADWLKQELAHLNVLAWPDFKIPNDPRVTRVGRFLRKTSLDELPQLWNLLRGELTLVGPRPCSVGVDKYELWQTERLEVTPGIFGRWQAEGRASVTFDERCRMDIGQIKARSLRGELRVTFQTLVALVMGRGAA